MMISCLDYYNFLIPCSLLHSCFSIVYYPPSSEIDHVDLVNPCLTPPINYQLVSHTVLTNILNLTHETLSWSQSWYNNKVMLHHFSTCWLCFHIKNSFPSHQPHSCSDTLNTLLHLHKVLFPEISTWLILPFRCMFNASSSKETCLVQLFYQKKEKKKNVILPSLPWLCLDSWWNSTPAYGTSMTF